MAHPSPASAGKREVEMPTFQRDAMRFQDNVALLESSDFLGRPCAETCVVQAVLTSPAGATLTIRAEPGKFISCAFLEWLSTVEGRATFTIDRTHHRTVHDFFGPLLDEEGHPTIDFLRQQGTTVVLTLRD